MTILSLRTRLFFSGQQSRPQQSVLYPLITTKIDNRRKYIKHNTFRELTKFKH